MPPSPYRCKRGMALRHRVREPPRDLPTASHLLKQPPPSENHGRAWFTLREHIRNKLFEVAVRELHCSSSPKPASKNPIFLPPIVESGTLGVFDKFYFFS